MTPADRALLILRLADAVEREVESIADAEAWQTGTARKLRRDSDLPAAVDHLRFFAGVLRSPEGRAASEFSTGDALALKVALRRVSGDRPCTVTLTIRGHGGVEIAQLTSEPVATTESPLVYEVSTLPLLSGSYSVFCDVNDAETRRLLHRLADPAPLEVRPGRSGEAGLVSLGGRWR